MSKKNISELLVEKGLSSKDVSFISKDGTDNILAIFYGKIPDVVWDAAAEYNDDNYVQNEIETSIYEGTGNIGNGEGQFTETSDTKYFEVK